MYNVKFVYIGIYQWRAVHGCCVKFQTFKVFPKKKKSISKIYIYGRLQNFQIIIRYFKYFYKKHFFVLKSILVLEMK